MGHILGWEHIAADVTGAASRAWQWWPYVSQPFDGCTQYSNHSPLWTKIHHSYPPSTVVPPKNPDKNSAVEGSNEVTLNLQRIIRCQWLHSYLAHRCYVAAMDVQRLRPRNPMAPWWASRAWTWNVVTWRGRLRPDRASINHHGFYRVITINSG